MSSGGSSQNVNGRTEAHVHGLQVVQGCHVPARKPVPAGTDCCLGISGFREQSKTGFDSHIQVVEASAGWNSRGTRVLAGNGKSRISKVRRLPQLSACAESGSTWSSLGNAQCLGASSGGEWEELELAGASQRRRAGQGPPIIQVSRSAHPADSLFASQEVIIMVAH